MAENDWKVYFQFSYMQGFFFIIYILVLFVLRLQSIDNVQDY